MRLLIFISIKHLMDRKRQSIVSLMGIVLGVAFFLAISSIMQGSQRDLIERLVDNSPHITVSDEFRKPNRQPVEMLNKHGAIEIRNVTPLTEIRGIRNYEQILHTIQQIPGVRAAATQDGQALVSFAGRDIAISLNGMEPTEITGVSTIEDYMLEGGVDNLIANRDGIIIGAELAKRLSVNMNDNITVATTTGQVRAFKVLGIFRTGRNSYDRGQAFADIKRVQALMNRPNRANSIIIKLDDPYQARAVAQNIENRYAYKTVSWQEATEDFMSTIAIRNIIMYTVVSAVLIVAAFGIYNIISTVVMEKHRDIAILKSVGFHARDIKVIFLIQGILLGCMGAATGLPLGVAMMLGLGQVHFKQPFTSEKIAMPLDWSWEQFALAGGFAIVAAMVAALLPASKAAQVQPVEILRGGAQ
ncbi:MAG: FtsX-like permease family protein [Alphaproteobacteria bacterium]|nr:FtsX-like permease family protein [Alphaproteobacteria bacterium]